MKIHLQTELDRLRKQLFHLSSVVEENLKLAILAVRDSDSELAETVRRNDAEVDALEVEVEEECLKILALHQPVAVDLRFLVAALKMYNDLERIGVVEHRRDRLVGQTAAVDDLVADREIGHALADFLDYARDIEA